METVNGMVSPAKIYQPRVCTTTWFKKWAIKCGYCDKNFVRFAVFGKPRCPYCRTINAPDFQSHF